jgi:hypothetical protein
MARNGGPFFFADFEPNVEMLANLPTPAEEPLRCLILFIYLYFYIYFIRKVH